MGLVMVLVQVMGCGCCVSIGWVVYIKLRDIKSKRRRKRKGTRECIENGKVQRQRKGKGKEKEKVCEEKYNENENESVTGSPETRHKIESFSDGDGFLEEMDMEARS